MRVDGPSKYLFITLALPGGNDDRFTAQVLEGSATAGETIKLRRVWYDTHTLMFRPGESLLKQYQTNKFRIIGFHGTRTLVEDARVPIGERRPAERKYEMFPGVVRDLLRAIKTQAAAGSTVQVVRGRLLEADDMAKEKKIKYLFDGVRDRVYVKC